MPSISAIMIGSTKMLQLITLVGFCWASFTWLFVVNPIHDIVTAHQIIDAINYPQQQISQRQATVHEGDTFSSCLLVMDDNHFLIEWLAYHYHALPLRRLVVGVDPRSETSPSPILDRWRGMMEITEWHDEDYMSNEELEEAEGIVKRHFGNITDSLVRHRARQRLFYYKCMKGLKKEGRTWTLMTDTDEFLRINIKTTKDYIHHDTVPSAREPASIRTMLQAEVERPGSNLTKSPCVQIPRFRYGSVESGKAPMSTIPEGYQPDQFLTLRWRKHAGPHMYWANKISKVMIDVSKVDWPELRPVESIHRPIKSLCSQRKLHIRPPDSVLAINHYLGSWEQYEYRNDARITDARVGELRSRKEYNKVKALDTGTNDDIRPWLQGFVENMGAAKAHFLLDQVGVLQPKEDSEAIASMPKTANDKEQPKEDSRAIAFMPKPANDKERCAILFFGLPRSFKDLVLPSIQKNIIQPNARYNCDFFVHYYYRTEEPKGRANKGGILDPTEILQLEEAVQKGASSQFHKVNNAQPVVEFISDTEEDFWAARNASIQTYRKTKDKHGHYLYFPWKAHSYSYPSSLDNIVRQWHSINGAWELMERSAAKHGVQYTRVGMFRSDVLYVTPVDIYETEFGHYDTNNNQAMLAPFGAMPVNDRMFYGPYEGVEIWATKRFSFLESYVDTCEPGWAMHSEKFLDGAIMPAIRELGISIVVNPDICFLRTRVGNTAVTNDCNLLGVTRGFTQAAVRGKVQEVLERQCSPVHKLTLSHMAITCDPPSSAEEAA